MDPKLLKNIEYPILIIVVLVTIISVLVISSATNAMSTDSKFRYAKLQLVWFFIGIIAMLFVMAIDYHSFAHWSNIIYGLSLLLLLLVVIKGEQGGGAQRWISIGPFRLQPSEFVKLSLAITLAKHLESKKSLKQIKDLISIMIHIALPILLVAKQPDLGTSLVLLVMVFGMMFVAGLSFKLIGGILVAGILSLPILWNFLRPFQKNRILVFINPYLDPLGKGYHVIQSKIAIGSGKLLGKGLFQGTQNQLDFLPVKHTDFIFAVLGEELGFIGGLVLFALFFSLLYYTIKIAFKARDLLGTYMVTGIASMWTFQILVNIGMNIGIMPVTGIPLPFVSYGGSSFIMNMMAVGLVLNVGMRRQKIMF